jgi:hypothetical protein
MQGYCERWTIGNPILLGLLVICSVGNVSRKKASPQRGKAS